MNCLAFVSNIPFETLDMFGGEPKVWDLKVIYRKVVGQNRGGFCYELNGLFHWMLSEIGFDVEMLQANEYMDDVGEFMAVSHHLTLVVTFPNGNRWLTDVGWGGSSFCFPLRMDEINIAQAQPNGIYRLTRMGDLFVVEKKKQIYLKEQGDGVKLQREEAESFVNYADGNCNLAWNKIFSFSTIPRNFEDFRKGFEYAQKEDYMLTRNPIVVLQNRIGRKFILGRRYVEKKCVDPETIQLISARQCGKEEIDEILRREFGIVLNFELKMPVMD